MEKTIIQPLIAAGITFVIAINAYRRKSLDLSGAISGFIIISTHLAAGSRFGALVLVFFCTSSKLTKVGEDKKRRVNAEFKDGGQRNWTVSLCRRLKHFLSLMGYSQCLVFGIQVLCDSGIATVLVVIVWKLTGWQDKCLDSKESTLVTALVGGILGHYCCCNGDTWSSELAVLGDEQPRLITTFKPVRRGTNGGVTKAGLLAAAAAGSVIGLTCFLFEFFTAKCTHCIALKQLLVIPLSAMAGLCGSLIDSLLGATLQFSGFCTLCNEVNIFQDFTTRLAIAFLISITS